MRHHHVGAVQGPGQPRAGARAARQPPLSPLAPPSLLPFFRLPTVWRALLCTPGPRPLTVAGAGRLPGSPRRAAAATSHEAPHAQLIPAHSTHSTHSVRCSSLRNSPGERPAAWLVGAARLSRPRTAPDQRPHRSSPTVSTV